MENSVSAHISFLMKDVNVLMKQKVRNIFEETGLTGPQIMLLGVLSKHRSMKISELSEEMNLSNSTVSGIIDRLEKQNYVERIRSKEDRRVVHVSLINDCHNMMHTAIHKKIEELLETKLKKAEPEDIEIIIKGLETLKRLMED